MDSAPIRVNDNLHSGRVYPVAAAIYAVAYTNS